MRGLKVGDLVRYHEKKQLVGFITAITPTMYRGYRIMWFNWVCEFNVDERDHYSYEIDKL